MSAQPLPAPPTPRRRPPAKPAAKAAPVKAALRGRLSLVPTPTRARRAPFVVLLLVLLASALIGLLLLNTASAQDSFRLHSLQDEDAVLQQRINALTGMADGLDDPATLAKKAAALGMVPGNPPVFLKRGQAIPKGAIRIGDLVYIPGAVPVTPPPPPPTPAVQASTKPAVKKPAVKKPVAARTPVVPAKVAPTKTPVTAGKTTTSTTPTTSTTGAKAPVATTAKPTTVTATKAPVATHPTTAPLPGGH